MRPVFLIPLLFLLALTACADSVAGKKTTYKPPATAGGMQCVNQCNQARDFCQQSCDLHNRECVRDVQTQALHDYDAYTREQFQSHAPIEFRPRDFERMTPCDDQKRECTENCKTHYGSCYESCGGKVETPSSCQFLCF
jgi:hypothetical protein